MIEYVLGFYFSQKLRNVALIKKDHPPWQAGKLNGIGGKVREEEIVSDGDEPPTMAMVREFKEEAGVDVEARRWIPYCKIIGPDYTLWCFTAWGDAPPTTAEREPVSFETVTSINTLQPEEIVSNVPWLMAMALMYIEPVWRGGQAPVPIYTVHGGPLP